MKKVQTITILVVLLISIYASTYAKEDVGEVRISPQGILYLYISNVNASLSISGSGIASVNNTITASTYVDSVKISTYLQKYENGSWVTLNHWTDTSNTYYLISSHTHQVTSGYNYRVLTYFYAYVGDESESTSRSETVAY